MRWRDVGLAQPPNWAKAIVIGVAAGAAMEVFELFVSQPLIVRMTGEYPDLSELRGAVGNLAHGVTATIDALLIYSGHYPGM
jgi:hypothetical protein